MKQFIFLFLLLFGFILPVFSQKKTNANPAGVTKKTAPTKIKVGLQAAYFVKNNRIKIRWAPVNEESWRMGNKYGYIIERRTIVRDGNLITGAEQIKSFRSYPCIADSMRYWEPLLSFNDNAAVMAQALYGESFELDMNNSSKLTQGPSLIKKSEENKQRYLFSMYAADNDFNVATMAGLGFLDSSAKTNEKYFYRIYAAGPKQIIKSDTALLFISFLDIAELPQTPEIYVEPSNKSIVLSWDMERTKTYYNSFIIQRSGDGGKTFRNLNQRPYTSMGQGNDPGMPNAIIFVDTTIKTGVDYKYRVGGINIFGELGPWSPVADGKALALLEGVPGIQGIVPDAKGELVLNWYFEDSVRNKIKGFELTHATNEGGPYLPILENIDAVSSAVKLPTTLPAGYLVVKAISKEGISRTSFPYLYQPEDSLPPSAPSGLSVSVDSTGRVELKWMPNTEKDLLGYKVFRTMVKGAEHAVLVDTVWMTNVFYDTLDLKLKNRKAYYTVTALDRRFNQSSMSKEIEIVKPDIIPPTSPIFSDYKINENSIEINWINPEEEDLKEVALQRKLSTATDWKTIFKTSKKEASSYIDKEAVADKKYSYKLTATDEAGLFSPEGQVLTIQTLPTVNRKVFKSLDNDLNRDKRLIYLRWQVQEKMVIQSIEVFRGTEKSPLELYKVLDGKTTELLDNDLLANTKYKYGIRALLPDGQYSEMLIKDINY
ncbi:MAG TPA: hypothetical protein VF487_09890 [Chitinophagaceae bacterium]